MLIITSPLNSPDTLSLLDQLTTHNHTKVLIVDIVGAIFNKQNEFYRNIAKNRDRWLVNNLLVLTTLTEKLKRFLNATFTTEYNNIYGGNTNTDTSSSQATSPTTATTTIISANGDLSVFLPMTTLSDFKTISLSTSSPLSSSSSSMSTLDQLSAETNNSTTFSEIKSLNDDKHFANFNEIQLRTIFSLFRTNFFNENCSSIVDKMSKIKLTTSISTPTTLSNVTSDDELLHNENALQACIQDSESLTKCESYLRSTTKLFPRLDKYNIKLSCQKIAEKIVKDIVGHQILTNSNNIDQNNMKKIENNLIQEFFHLIPSHNDTKSIDNFSFFDFIITKLISITKQKINFTTKYPFLMTNQTTTTAINSSVFDFCVLDFHVSRYSINETAMATAFVWRPFLILRQSEIHQNIYDTHPLLVDHRNWFFDRGSRFWTCGLLCWILAGIVMLLLICILVAGVTVGLAIR